MCKNFESTWGQFLFLNTKLQCFVHPLWCVYFVKVNELVILNRSNDDNEIGRVLAIQWMKNSISKDMITGEFFTKNEWLTKNWKISKFWDGVAYELKFRFWATFSIKGFSKNFPEFKQKNRKSLYVTSL